MHRLVLATRNAGKRREYERLLAGVAVELLDLRAFPDAPDVVEACESYLGNARAKAIAAARHTGLPALADDSGIEVDALGGAPGVRSARFAGPRQDEGDNLALLLERLAGVPRERRGARFRCVIVVATPDGQELVAEGTCEGEITSRPRGERGFGYDPIFFFPAASRTLAEIGDEEKDRVSHRGRACERLRSSLDAFLKC